LSKVIASGLTADRTFTFPDASATILTESSSTTKSPIFKGLTLPAEPSTATDGVVFRGSSYFMHTFSKPGSIGNNTFVGWEAGNLTMGPGGGDPNFYGCYNTGIGTRSLYAVTTGYNNLGCGENTLTRTTTGSNNTAVGAGAMAAANTIGEGNVAVGLAANYDNLDGSWNTCVGTYVGRNQANTASNVSGTYNTWLGAYAGPNAAGTLTQTIAIGFDAHPTKSNQAVIGASANITETVLNGNVVLGATALLTFGGITASFAALKDNGFGTGLDVRLANDSAFATLRCLTLTATVAIVAPSAGFGTNTSASGLVKLANNDGITSRNAANSADIYLLYLNGSNQVVLGGGGAIVPTGAASDIGTTAALWRNHFASGYYEGTEMTAPSAGAVNTGRLYFEDNGSGKTRLMCLFNTGAAQQIAIQP